MLSTIATVGRMSGWKSSKTIRNPLLCILHISYFFFIIGFILTAVAGFTDIISIITIIHTFSMGLCSSILVAIMMRVSKVHNGLPLFANAYDNTAYIFIFVLNAGRLSAGRLSAGRLSAGRLSAGRLSADYVPNPVIAYHIAKTFLVLVFVIFLIHFVPVFLKLKK